MTSGLDVLTAAFIGGNFGVITALYVVVRRLRHLVEADPQLGKIEVRVYLNDPDHEADGV